MNLGISVDRSLDGFDKRLMRIGKAQKRAVVIAMNEGLKSTQDFVSKTTAPETPLKKGRGKKSVGSRAFIRRSSLVNPTGVLVIAERKAIPADTQDFKVRYKINRRGRKVQRGIEVKFKGKTLFFPNAIYSKKKNRIYDVDKNTGKVHRLKLDKLQLIFNDKSSVDKMKKIMLINFEKSLSHSIDNELRKIKD